MAMRNEKLRGKAILACVPLAFESNSTCYRSYCAVQVPCASAGGETMTLRRVDVSRVQDRHSTGSKPDFSSLSHSCFFGHGHE